MGRPLLRPPEPLADRWALHLPPPLRWDHSWDQTHRYAPSYSGSDNGCRPVGKRLNSASNAHPRLSGPPLHTREAVGSNPTAPIWVQYDEESYELYPSVALDIALEPALHGHGYGRRALKVAIEFFVAKGHHRFTVDPAVTNERAMRSYTAVGFKPVGVLRCYGRNPDGTWHDALLMDLIVLDDVWS